MFIYNVDGSSKLIIMSRVFEVMNNYKQTSGKCESGGILLGKVRTDYSEFILTDVSEPTPMDKGSLFSFFRSKKSAQEIINKKWKESDGEIMYLGEWHTHPETYPTPSSPDRKLLNDCLKCNVIYTNRLFMIILGNTGELYVGSQTTPGQKMITLERI